jgi:hypothetical protein
MTRTIFLSSTIAVIFAGGLSAATAADANGDGVLTIDEVQAAMPDVTAEDFSTMDLDGSGTLDAAEIEAAQEAGLMPT